MRIALLLLLFLIGCSATPGVADLVIHDAALFDARSKRVEPHQTIIVRDGIVTAVVPSASARIPRAAHFVNARGRLLTPGIIDVHHHTAVILADSSNSTGGSVANLSMEPDSIASYRRAFAEAYLPHGVTVVREAGGDDRYLSLMQAWMDPVSWAPDLYPSGGALVSHEQGRTPYAGHTVVQDSVDAVQTVRTYYDAGFRHVKLYWRLRMPELRAALKEAQTLGMAPYGHIDYKVVSIRDALELGLRNFEHAYTLGVDVLTVEENRHVWRRTTDDILNGDMRGAFFMGIMELFNDLGEDDPRMMSLIEDLATSGASVTPTLHIFAAPLGLADFQPAPPNDFADTSGWTDAQVTRARRGYNVLSAYVRRLHDSGVSLNLGTDAAEPGRAALSEMLLLHAAGIPMVDTLQIATLNSARALGLEDVYGTVEVGRRAHFVLFDENPLASADALLAGKTTFKDGITYPQAE